MSSEPSMPERASLARCPSSILCQQDESWNLDKNSFLIRMPTPAQEARLWFQKAVMLCGMSYASALPGVLWVSVTMTKSCWVQSA